MRHIYDELRNIENLRDKLKINETHDVIRIDFHEYFHLNISGDCIWLNEGVTHWHPSDDAEIIQDVLNIANGNDVYLESIDFFTRTSKYGRICHNELRILDKEKFEKKKENYLAKKHLRIYTVNEIIKHSIK
jgi:hypothetical protein